MSKFKPGDRVVRTTCDATGIVVGEVCTVLNSVESGPGGGLYLVGKKPFGYDWSYFELVTKQDTPNPITWCDRIQEIDKLVENLEEERVSLVQSLVDEGFSLLYGKVVRTASSVLPDMNDPVNWKAGDFVECLTDSAARSFIKGQHYKISEMYGGDWIRTLKDSDGDQNGWGVINFKWHSRPDK